MSEVKEVNKVISSLIIVLTQTIKSDTRGLAGSTLGNQTGSGETSKSDLNLPELRGTCQNKGEPARFICKENVVEYNTTQAEPANLRGTCQRYG